MLKLWVNGPLTQAAALKAKALKIYPRGQGLSSKSLFIQVVWPPGSADRVCLCLPVMTQV